MANNTQAHNTAGTADLEDARFAIVEQLITNTTPLTIHINGDCSPVHLEKALLASVSPSLAAHCSADRKLLIGKDTFRIFVAWIFHRKFRIVEQGVPSWFKQKSLAEAWNLGAEFDIPAFQNAAMRMILRSFESAQVEVDAMKEAYRNTKRETRLQEALVTQLARDSLDDCDVSWDRRLITKYGMDKVPGFCLDLALALVSEGDHAGVEQDIHDLLVAEVPPVHEDSDEDESITDG